MKKVLYVTGSRAEYGIVKRLLKKLQDDTNIDFSLIVTGMHLSPQYGNTYKVIEEDGINIDYKIPITLNSINNQAIISSMAECLDKFGAHFQQHHYDAVIVLGDRYEIYSVAIAAAMHNLPLIHLHGGEQTLGNYDEFIRHNITKMAKLHLTATETYRQRVIQLGEAPETVVNVGSLGAENGLLLDLPTKEALEQKWGQFKRPYFMVAFHPETLNLASIKEQAEHLINALDKFKHQYDFVFIGSNADTQSDILFDAFQQYTQDNNFKFFTSVKPEEYLALIKYSKGLIGNSSSGLLEAPSLKVGTVNIGNRQQGRVRGESVIDVALTQKDIEAGITKLISKEFQEKLKSAENPYLQENCLEKAYSTIIKFIEQDNSATKCFFDLP